MEYLNDNQHMNKKKFLFWFFLCISCWGCNKSVFKPSAELFDFNWKFSLGEQAGAEQPGFYDKDWRILDLPHDYSIEQPFDSLNPTGTGGAYAFGGVGWYRKSFILKPRSNGKRVVIRFDGIYRNSDVWINGHHLGFRPYGYSSFSYDLSAYLNPVGSPNVLAIKVNTAEQPNSRWYTGAGIYRHVWLLITDETHLVPGGVFVKTHSVEPGLARLASSSEIKNNSKEIRNLVLKSIITDPGKDEAAAQTSFFVLHPGDSILVEQEFEVQNPALWSTSSPNLYSYNCTLWEGNKLLDQYESKIGIRTFRFDPDSGFFLNGNPLKLNGTNNHHDGGPLGAACLKPTFVRQLTLLKEMGCNALRMSHNPPAPELLQVADSLGFLVIDEIFDEWTMGKREKGYAPFFENWHQRDVTDWIRRDRNHPSVIAWSLGNEVVEQRSGEHGLTILEKLKSAASAHDTTRPFTSGCNEIPHANSSGFTTALDIVGYNYREPMYEADHFAYPKRVIYGSETVIYPLHPGNEFPLHSYAEWLKGQKASYIAGEFLWTGFDYLGEAGIGAGGTSTEPWNYWPKWPWKSAICGVFDLCGFDKPAYWFRKALWSDEPMVYLAVPFDSVAFNHNLSPFWGWPKVWPHWNQWPMGELLPVQVYTNCRNVELLLNGRSLGKKEWDIVQEPFLVWQVPYEVGTLEAIGFSDEGEACRFSVSTVGEPVAIRLSADRSSLYGNKQDLAYVKAEVVDKDGCIVPFANNLIEFELSGDGKLASVGNGDPACLIPFKGNKMEAYFGRCLAIVQSGSSRSKLVLSAKSEGLRMASLPIQVE